METSSGEGQAAGPGAVASTQPLEAAQPYEEQSQAEDAPPGNWQEDQEEGDDEEGGTLHDEAHELALIREFGAHPLMHRVQETLHLQLRETHDRLSEELRVRQEDLKKTREKREEVGVELYGQQQQLARLQLMLESTHESLSGCAKHRVKVEVSSI